MLTGFSKNIKEISKNIASEFAESLGEESPKVMSELENGLYRNQLIAKIISTALGVAASFTVTYFGIKWITDAMDPTKKEKKQAQVAAQKMLTKLGVESVGTLSDYELCVAANLVDPRGMQVSWNNIGGLEETIEEIKESVILPFQRANLFRNSALLQPPKGILLYGPPGCGKTMVAQATAKAAGARFINLQVSTLVDKWYGESQKRAEAVFSLANKLQPVIIFIDEIDSFLRSRSSSDHEATAMMKTQFMSLWDGMSTDPSQRIMIMGATNRRSDVDAAILRRMPSQFYIGMPNLSQRKSILRLILNEENVDSNMDYSALSQLCEGFSGSDLREVCRMAAVAVLHEHIEQNPDTDDEERLRDMNLSDMQSAINKVRLVKSHAPHLPLD